MRKSAIILMIMFLFLSNLASATTLKVGSTGKYHTIQAAVNAAHNGDTISVASGTYREDVKINKRLTILGIGYPKVDGMEYHSIGGQGTVNGFSFQKYGISGFYAGPELIRNNYFYNCGIDLEGGTASGCTIMNNQIKAGTVIIYDVPTETLVGNTIYNSKCALYIGDSYPTVKNCIFKNNKYAVYIYDGMNPGRLTTFSGNKYSGNKYNFGWGDTPLDEL